MNTQKIVLVGGGSGGHFYPLMAIAEALRSESKKEQREPLELYYMGPSEYDPGSLKSLDISFVSCPSGKWRPYRSIDNFLDIFKTFLGIFAAIGKLFVLYPDVVMSKGGYTSVPVVMAAWLLRIPIVVHESDATAGKANRLASHFARRIAVSYPETAASFPSKKTSLTGIPVRNTLLKPAPLRKNIHEILGIKMNLPILLVIGGSQGAERINQLILESLDELLPLYTIIHQTGMPHFENVSNTARSLITDATLAEHYRPVAFMKEDLLNQAMHAASIILARAGSGSIYEIALHGKPSIIIPIPEEISHDQRTNAYAYARTGAATVIEEANLRDGLLTAEIARIMNDKMMYGAMSEAALSFGDRNAAHKLALMLIEITDEH